MFRFFAKLKDLIFYGMPENLISAFSFISLAHNYGSKHNLK